jgi:alpha-glucosidase
MPVPSPLNSGEMGTPNRQRLPVNPGRLEKFDTNALGWVMYSQHDVCRLYEYGEGIVRIHRSRTETSADHSYAVVASARQPTAALLDHGDHLDLVAKEMTVRIRKTDSSLAFLTPDGRCINQDEPGLTTSWVGEQVTCYKTLQPGERFIGLGEKTGHLDRRGAGYQHWNTDAFSYTPTTDPMYSSTPFYMGVHQGLLYGIFFDNSCKSFFNFGASNNRFASFGADGGDLNYYFITGKCVAEIIGRYTHLTGRMPLPPVWSLGYQQCRYSYYPDHEVLSVANTFREKKIPADVIVLDIHYMDQYKIFTWHPEHFPDPAGLVQALKEKGFHVVVMCDPGIKAEPGYVAYEKGIAQDVFIKYPDGQPYTAQVWPGWCHFPDFTKSSVRTWWQEQFQDYVRLGVEGFWNDMNEIATWGNYLPENVLFDFEGPGTTMREARNVYGLQMARSTYEGTKALMGNRRPFNLTRSGFAGIQRYAALWTGDNVSSEEHMLLGVRLVNSLGLTGIAFAGYDAGGFVGNASPRLFVRWLSIAALSPFFRGHTMINTADSEPWSYGEQVENIARNYIRFRYQLLPYLYSLFFEAAQLGIPVQRSLAIEFPFEDAIFDHRFEHQYLFGPALLVVPVESSKDITKVFLPQGEWYYLFDGKKFSGGGEIFIECPLHKLPVFVRAGSILPMRAAGATMLDPCAELELHVYKGSTGTTFTLYEDDGVSFDHERGASSTRTLHYHPVVNRLEVTATTGSYASPYRHVRLVFHGFEKLDQVRVNGEPCRVANHGHSFFTPLEKYDPIKDPDTFGTEPIQEINFQLNTSAQVVEW